MKQFLKLGRSPSHRLNEFPGNFNVRGHNLKQNIKADLIHFTAHKPPTYGDLIALLPDPEKAEIPQETTELISLHLCDFIGAAHETLMQYPTLPASELYGHRLQNWAALVGDAKTVAWAEQQCPQLPKV